MLAKLAVPLSVALATLAFAPLAVAMPPDQCPRWCSGRSDYYECVADCIQDSYRYG